MARKKRAEVRPRRTYVARERGEQALAAAMQQAPLVGAVVAMCVRD
jgi:hypothetical protein